MEDIMRFQVNMIKWLVYSNLTYGAMSWVYVLRLASSHLGVYRDSAEEITQLALKDLISQGFIEEVGSFYNQEAMNGKSYRKIEK